MSTQAEQTNAQQGAPKLAEKSDAQYYPGRQETPQEAWGNFVDRVQAGEKREGAPNGEPKEPADAKRDAKPTPEGQGDRDGQQPARPDGRQPENKQPQPQQSGYDRLLERASKEPDFDKFVERMQEPFFPLSREGNARYQVMAQAISQVSNREEVLYFLARPENAEIAFKMQDAPPHKIAAVIHTISAELRFGMRKAQRAEEKPRAPKPPAEVGGRGTVSADRAVAAARNGNFPDFEREMNARARSQR